MKRLNIQKLNKRAFKRSIWSSISKVVSIALSAGAGGMIHKMVGDGLQAWGLASLMVIFSFFLMLFSEYNKETE